MENNTHKLDQASRTLTIFHDSTVIPTQITLINILQKWMGDIIVNNAIEMEQQHPNYVLEYKESSAKLADAHFKLQDPTVMYSFGVHKEDLVFHKHAGRRAINGTTGSGGAILKFSHVDFEDLKTDPDLFFKNMTVVHLPADSQFMLKFDGQVCHQFGPRDPNHNAFFAVSVHPQEDQNLDGEILKEVHEGKASIPLLTEPVPENIIEKMTTDQGYMDMAQSVYMDTL